MLSSSFKELTTGEYKLPGCSRISCNRGQLDCKPKRINASKALDSLVRNVSLGVNPKPQIYCFTNEASDDLKNFGKSIRDVPNIVTADNNFENLMGTLLATTSPRGLAVLGFAEGASYRSRIKRLGYLDSLMTDLSPKIADRLLNTSESLSAAAAESEFVAQEKPGRFSVLDMYKLTRRSSQKRLKVLAEGKRGGESNDLSPRGWGFGAALFSDSKKTLDIRHFRLLAGAAEFGPQVPQDICTYLKHRGLVVPDSSVYLAGANFAELTWISDSLLSAEMVSLNRIYAPDIVWGWNPTLTILEVLVESKIKPTVLIYWGDYPRIDLVVASNV